MLNIKKTIEQKTHVVHRLVNSTIKFIQDNINDLSKPSTETLNYELPESFTKAVNNARKQAGYDSLPRFHHRPARSSSRRNSCSSSLSSLSSDQLNEDQQSSSGIYESASINDLDKSMTKKVPFRRKPRQNLQQPPPPSNLSIHSSQPRRRMPTNPRLVMVNRFPRPRNFVLTRPRMFMPQQQQMFRLRFR